MALRYPNSTNALAMGSAQASETNLLGSALRSPGQEEAARYRTELLAKPVEEIASLYTAEKQAEAAAAEAGRSFNLPGAMRPDYEHYGRCARWTLEEAVALSFGRDPDRVSVKLVQPHAGISAFAGDYMKRWKEAQRSIAAGQLWDPVSPGLFISWATNNKIKLPDALLAVAINRGVSLKNWQNLYEEAVQERKALEVESKGIIAKWQTALEQARAMNAKLKAELACRPSERPASRDETTSTVTRSNMLRLIAAMSIRGYGYDPRNSRNQATADVLSDLAQLGMAMTDDTVLKYLKAAAELVPPDALADAVALKPKSGKPKPKSG